MKFASTLLVLLAGVVSTVSAADLSFTWPTAPEANVQFSMRWSGGTPPYVAYVLTPDLSKYYYKYNGTALSTTYNFPLDVGTVVAFQVRDSANLEVTSPTNIKVIATLDLSYPTTPQVGVASQISWTGGLSPYTVYALTPDLSKYYFTYSGAALSTTWTPNVAAGTVVVFRVTDTNGVQAVSNQVTIGANAGASQSQLSVLSTASVASVNSLNSNQASQSVLSLQSLSSLAALSTSLGAESLSLLSAQSTASVASVLSASLTSGPTSTPGGSSLGTPTSTSSTGSFTSNSATSSSTTTSAPSKKSSSNTGAIAGGVVGGVVGLALIAALGFFLARRNGSGAGKDVDYFAGAPGTGGPEMREPTLPNTGYAPSAHDSPFASEPYGAGSGAGGGGAYPAYGGAGAPYAPSVTTAGAAGVGAGAAYYAGAGAGNNIDRGTTPGSGSAQRPMSEASTNLPYAQGGWGQQQQPYDPSVAGSANPSFPPSQSHDAYSSGTGTGTGSTPHSGRPFNASPGPHPQGWSGLPEV